MATPVRTFACPDEQRLGFAAKTKGKLILAPLTKGGTPPFRKLCTDYGAEVTMGEMSFARMLLKGDKIEYTRTRKHEGEVLYGFQFATKQIDEGIGAAKKAAEAGCDFVGLNCGCPIYEASRRGLGAVLLRKPAKLARLVSGIAEGSPIPLTVKIRLGPEESDINVKELVGLLQDSGAVQIDIHGRTMEQRYRKAADWSLIEEVASTSSIPIVGNGDILTYYDAKRRLDSASPVHAAMIGRGALIRPYIFQEVKEGRELHPTVMDRIGMYRQLASNMKAYFGDDAKGRGKADRFYTWHFSFFTRWRPLPADKFEEASRIKPLITTRLPISVVQAGEPEDHRELGYVERLLRCELEEAHGPLANAIWEATSDQDAYERIEQLSKERIEEFEGKMSKSGDRSRENDEREGRESSADYDNVQG